jgi:hypothetical protein
MVNYTKCFGILKLSFFGQTLKSSNKVLLKLAFFFMTPSIVVKSRIFRQGL